MVQVRLRLGSDLTCIEQDIGCLPGVLSLDLFVLIQRLAGIALQDER